ncbi:MAG: ABC transporter substrate-binding protein [Galactobacter sp.]
MLASKKRSLIRTTAALAALGLGLSACASTPESGEGTTNGGTLKFAVANDPVSLNPAALGGGNDTWYVTRQLFDSLVFQNPKTLELEPWLAKEFSSNDEATEWTFKLRDDVTFSDGSKLTASTVKGNIDSAKKAGATSGAAGPLTHYKGTEVIDEHTVVVKFSEPNVAFPVQASSTWFGIVSDASLKVPFEDRTNGSKISGSGAFELDSYKKDQSVVLSKRKGYEWAPTYFDNDEGAALDKVEFSIVPEPGNRTGGLTSGQVDVAGGVAPNDIESVAASSNIVERANPGAVFGISFNEESPLTRDPLVREAISYAVDAKEVRDGALNDHFPVAKSPLGHLTQDYADVSADIAKQDPDKAAEILDEAGWKVGSDGIREKDGKQLNLRFLWGPNFSANADSIAILQQQLEDVGFKVKQLSDPATAQQIRADKAYDISWSNTSSTDPDVLRTNFTDSGAYSNPVSDQDLEDRLKRQVTVSDEAERADLVKQIQRDLVTGFHFVPVHELATIIGTSDDVDDLELGADTRLTLLINTTKAH